MTIRSVLAGLLTGLATAAAIAVGAAGPAPLRAVPVGEIVGVEYLPEKNRFFILATVASAGDESTLWRDAVVDLTRVATEHGADFGFSLDFRRLGDRDFKAEDVGDLAEFQEIIERETYPALEFVRQAVLKDLTGATPGKAESSLKRKITDALNAALKQENLFPPLPRRVSPDSAPLLNDPKQARRARRLMIEDLLGPGLIRDTAKQYVIQWKPQFAHAALSRILGGGRTENLILKGDALLKSLATGEGAPSDVRFGPTQLNLCAAEISERLRSGEYTPGQYVTYFDFDLRYVRAPELEGQSMWFRDAKLFVRTDGATGGDAPECYKRFAASLTRHLPDLLSLSTTHPVSATLRDLLTTLTLNRAIGLLTGLAHPDNMFLRAIPREKFDNRPPKVAILPIISAGVDKPMGVAISGGVHFESGAAPQSERTIPAAAAGNEGPADPGFIVTSVEIEGRRLLKIDISDIVGLHSNVPCQIHCVLGPPVSPPRPAK